LWKIKNKKNKNTSFISSYDIIGIFEIKSILGFWNKSIFSCIEIFLEFFRKIGNKRVNRLILL